MSVYKDGKLPKRIYLRVDVDDQGFMLVAGERPADLHGARGTVVGVYCLVEEGELASKVRYLKKRSHAKV